MSPLLLTIFPRVKRSMYLRSTVGLCLALTRSTMAVCWSMIKAGVSALTTLTFMCTSKTITKSWISSIEPPRSTFTMVATANSSTTSKPSREDEINHPLSLLYPLSPFFLKVIYSVVSFSLSQWVNNDLSHTHIYTHMFFALPFYPFHLAKRGIP